LQVVATSELKCAKALSEIEEFSLTPLAGILPQGSLDFFISLQSGAANKALQAFEYSEAIQSDCISPMDKLITGQQDELEDLVEIAKVSG
jgi:hypothetical protein